MSGLSVEAVGFLIALGAVVSTTFLSLIFKFGGGKSVQWLLYVEGLLDIAFTLTVVTYTSSTVGVVIGVFAGFAFTFMITALRFLIGTRGVGLMPMLSWFELVVKGHDVPFEAVVTHKRGWIDNSQDSREVQRLKDDLVEDARIEVLERIARLKEEIRREMQA
jgi:hypothetical protein